MSKWTLIKESIQFALNQYKAEFDDETINTIHHYINHDEYEMAFEGLFIEIMKLNISLKIDLETYWNIAESLNLSNGTFFDPDFWYKFQIFYKNNINSK